MKIKLGGGGGECYQMLPKIFEEAHFANKYISNLTKSHAEQVLNLMKAFCKITDKRSTFPHREALEFLAVGCSETIKEAEKTRKILR